MKVQDENTGFQQDFFARLLSWCYAYQDCYWISDCRIFGPPSNSTWRERIRHRLKTWGSAKGWASRNFHLLPASEQLVCIMERSQEYAHGYALLADAYSKQVYLDILSYRVLGPRHVRMPANIHNLWRNNHSADRLMAQRNTGKVPISPGRTVTINQYDVPGKTGILHLHMSPNGYRNWIELHQYDYDRDGHSIGVESGDVVIDGGSCWGDTAIFIADRVAPGGRIYAFEFVPENANILKMNLDSNPDLAGLIVPVEKALSDVSGRMIQYNSYGPGTRLEDSPSKGAGQVATLAVDDLVEQNRLSKVDFIKMDIEGSELQALRGAHATLCRFRPKLAISAYHRPEDLYILAGYIDSLDLGYKFYMDHFSIHLEETVLFADCEKKRDEKPTSNMAT